ncbi:hypothetical protein EIN_064800 [Entamoeba invadens IP1]|uniref:Uncharacterized protein n=1 Tax=Entamoeba invadens IP1 TaxID=370355 RepID=A0A0A1TXJ6_ENTIV|nr:hypothetical protein EIN_064800 [Entamoeba invadens IP1]ELP84245.1 hypothetical protein EIN_064800 [Entamoeba invadens IP1]|eukprot:XP_004183591.1 hypothetical protein EIN_064800 [Entamoeba invadens IP1]
MTRAQDSAGDKHEINFKTIRNTLVYQQGALVSLLVQHIPLSFKKPFKKAKVFEQLLTLDTIGEGEASINVPLFTEKRCEERFNFEIKNGVLPKTAKRRLESNRLTEPVQLLCDLLREFGYYLEIEKKRGRKDTLKTEHVTSVWKDGACVLNEEQMIEKGKYMNGYVLDLLEKKEPVTIYFDLKGIHSR